MQQQPHPSPASPSTVGGSTVQQPAQEANTPTAHTHSTQSSTSSLTTTTPPVSFTSQTTTTTAPNVNVSQALGQAILANLLYAQVAAVANANATGNGNGNGTKNATAGGGPTTPTSQQQVPTMIAGGGGSSEHQQQQQQQVANHPTTAQTAIWQQLGAAMGGVLNQAAAIPATATSTPFSATQTTTLTNTTTSSASSSSSSSSSAPPPSISSDINSENVVTVKQPVVDVNLAVDGSKTTQPVPISAAASQPNPTMSSIVTSQPGSTLVSDPLVTSQPLLTTSTNTMMTLPPMSFHPAAVNSFLPNLPVAVPPLSTNLASFGLFPPSTEFPPTNVDSSYQQRSSAQAQFLKYFKDLPFEMQKESFKQPPPFIGSSELLRALVSLPLQGQAKIIKGLPLSTQKSLIKSLTPLEKKRLLDVISGRPIGFFDEDLDDQFCHIPNEFIERVAKMAQEEGVQSNKYINQPFTTNQFIQQGEFVTQPTKMTALMQTLTGSNPVNMTPMNSLSIPSFAPNQLSSSILSTSQINLCGSRRPEVRILDTIQKMMFSFGDVHYITDTNPMSTSSTSTPSLTLSWPSLYTALRIRDYLYDFLQCILFHLSKKQGLPMLAKLFPLQSRVFFKWRSMNTAAKQEQASKLKLKQQAENSSLGLSGPLGAMDEDEAESDEDHRHDRRRARRIRSTTRGSKSSRRPSNSSASASAPMDAAALAAVSMPTTTIPTLLTATNKRGRPSNKTATGSGDTNQTKRKRRKGANGTIMAEMDEQSDQEEPAKSKRTTRTRSKKSSGGSEGSGSDMDQSNEPISEDESDSASDGNSDDSSFRSSSDTEDSGGEDDEMGVRLDDDEECDPDVGMVQVPDVDPELIAVEEMMAVNTPTTTATLTGTTGEDKSKAQTTSNQTSQPIKSSIITTDAANATLSNATETVSSESVPSTTSTTTTALPPRVNYELHLSALDLKIGPVHRLLNQDALSAPMSDVHFHTFVKAREASFVSPNARMKTFVGWLNLPNWVTRNMIQLLGYLAWDRIGMVIEVTHHLRQSSRHSRSELPFTIYEVNRAIQFLEADPQTSTNFLRDQNYLAQIKQEVNQLANNTAYATATQLSTDSATTINPSSSPHDSTATTTTTNVPDPSTHASIPLPLVGSSVLDHLQQLQHLTTATGIDFGTQFGSTRTTNKNQTTTTTTATPLLPPTRFSTVPPTTPTPIIPPTMLFQTTTSSFSSLAPHPTTRKSGRFTDAQRVRLTAMADRCAWKYRAKNPEVQAIHAEEGLTFEQIRGFLANNKPITLKRKKGENQPALSEE